MRILQVIPTLSAGGAEGFISNLSCELTRRGHEVGLLLLGGVRGDRGRVLHQRLFDAGVQVIGVNDRKASSPKNILELLSFAKTFKPHVVQANLRGAEIACALVRAAWRGQRPLFVRRLANTVLYSGRFGRVSYLLRDHFYDWSIACSEAVNDRHASELGRSYRGNSSTIRNGVCLYDGASGMLSRASARSALGLADDTFVIAHIGSMHGGGDLSKSQKGHDVLLKTFAAAFGGDSRIRLVLAGEGKQRKLLEAFATSLRISPQVQFLGGIPEPWPLLAAADVFFFPSRYEGMPNALLEAASCALPVVASDLAEIRSINRNIPWILCPVDDVASFSRALRTIYDEIDLYRSRGRALAKVIAESFSMERCAADYEACYTRLLS